MSYVTSRKQTYKIRLMKSNNTIESDNHLRTILPMHISWF